MKMRIPTKSGLHVVKNLSRNKAIKEYCLNCSGFSRVGVRDCIMKECCLYPYRAGICDNSKDRSVAIRKYCLNCCCNQPGEVSKCISFDCPLWAYRKSITDRSMEIKD